ncbi:hypothetical protein H0A43_03220 [Arcobacter lanthieri]|uniref:helix-turn-helix transcriptional regulator n=1 Tax=Aliarcobacter lanthieri TaxID=1355374 RepID=UPI001922FC87|nr:hypothetical protein [Aliarcobacter lanthieri]MBL3519467.1 hypothetical protein [Aliarcobacter lanthieri]
MQVNKAQVEQLLKDIGLSQDMINQLLIRSEKSKLIKNLFENIYKNQSININTIVESLITADRFSLISCNKRTLAKITGLSERTIDERRRAGEIPYIQLSGTTNEKGGRKSIIFDPFEVMQYFEKNKRNVQISSSN